MAQIRLERLGKRFGKVTAASEVSLETATDEFLVLLGPSGCGKTTVLRMLAGLLSPSEGRILLDGRDITHAPPKDRDLAMVFQNYALYPHMTVAKNIGFSLKLKRLPKSEVAARVQEAADMLQLGDLLHRRPRELSGGQRQRVALGRAIVRQPKAFLMDEPLSNLDAKLRTATRSELTDLHRRLGTTFVYVTHDQVEAMTMATRVAIMNDGVLEQVGTPTEVFDQPATAFVAGFIGAPPMNLLPADLLTEGGRVMVRGDGFEARLWHGSTPPRQVLLGVRPEHLRPRTADDERSGDGPTFRVAVNTTENLGSEEVAICTLAARTGATGDTPTIQLRGDRPIGTRAGDRLELTCDAGRLCVFDAPTGRRLVWHERAATVPPSTADRRPVVVVR